MESINIVHCADIHFDTPFTAIGERAAVRKDEIRITFSNIIESCIQRNAALLLISGDLFDAAYVTEETIRFIISSFRRIPDTKIFISPGNHDPYMSSSRYASEIWPENVHIFKNNFIEFVELPEYKVRVYGAAFTSPYVNKNIMDGFNCIKDDYINIMTIHGELVSSGTKSDYNPIASDSVALSYLNYLALGHKHTYVEGLLGATCYAYPGAPEGRGFDELGDKGIISGTISKNKVSLEFIKTSQRNYYEKEIDISGLFTHEDICNRIQNAILPPDSASSHLYKVILTGYVENGFRPDINLLLSRLNDKFFYIKIVNRLKTKLNFEALKKESSLKGIFTRKMFELANSEGIDITEGNKYYDALVLGLQAFDGEVKIDEN